MANGEPAVIPQPSLKQASETTVQANLGDASRVAENDRARDWSLFFFFRILPEAEIRKDVDRVSKYMKAWIKDNNEDEKKREGHELLTSLRSPAAVNAGLVDQKKKGQEEKRGGCPIGR